MAIVTYNDNGTIKVVKFGNYVVSTDADPIEVEPYVRFVSASARTITPKYTNSGVTLQYSVDNGASWTTISSGSETTSSTEHWFRGQATGTKSLFTSTDVENTWTFSGDSDLKVYGNLNFLLCDTLGDEVAPTTLGDFCYSLMFASCTSLTTPPSLPATTLVYNCYSGMFASCTSLTTAPELPATTLADYCYSNMFYNCTSLTIAPSLPATTLVYNCYYNMFYGCTSLTTAPELPATTLGVDCYYNMFYGCTSFKVSSTKTGSYIYAWRIPTSGTGTTEMNWNISMLRDTGGTFTSDPTINTTYYVENEPVGLGAVDQYYNYAKDYYTATNNGALFESAWEHSLTVDPSEISQTQYPNGETEGVIIPHGVTSIGFYAFGDLTTNNKPLIIPNSVTSFEYNAFAYWYANTYPLIIPNSVTSIDDNVFYGWGLVPYVEIQAITPPTLASSGAFNEQNNAPIYVPDVSVDAYKTATNWVDLADRIFSINDK